MRAVVCWGLQKLNVDLGISNVYLENLIFHLIGSGISNVRLSNFQRPTLYTYPLTSLVS